MEFVAPAFLADVAQFAAGSGGVAASGCRGGGVRRGEGPGVGAEAVEASRAAVRRVIGNYFPLDPVLDREVPAGLPSSGRAWLVDPLGGTLNFVLGPGLWSVSVAAVQGGEVVAGAVWVPPDVLHAA